MSTPTPLPQAPSDPGTPSIPDEPLAPTPSEPTAPTPAEPTVPLTPETAPAPAGHDDGDDSAGAFADDDGAAIGTAEMDADNAVEQDMIDAIDPAGRPD